MNTTTIFSEGWIDVVFDGRNKAYGAYELRRITDRTLIIAAIFTSAMIAGAAIIALMNGFHSQPPAGKEFPLTGDTLQPPPIIAGLEKIRTERVIEQTRIQTDENRFEIVDTIVEHIDTVETPANTSEGTENNTGDGLASAGGGIPGDGVDGGAGVDNNPIPPEPLIGAEIMPEFPGGYPEFVKFISSNFIYPGFLKDIGIEGTVYVGFVVETDGSVSQVKVMKGVNRMLDEEVMRVIKIMPKWKPGMQNGHAVRVRYTVPVYITLR